MMKEKIDFRTPVQKKRDKRDEEIYALYLDLREKEPDRSRYSIWCGISNKFELNPHRVRYAIERQEKKLNKGGA